jgi:hypothetical protein
MCLWEPMMWGRMFEMRCFLAGLALISSPAWAGTIIITEQEANLPPEHIVDQRSITRGPRIELIQPNKATYSPMHFQLKFQSFGGSAINTESVRVTYLKAPEIDITARLIRFARPAGIDIPDAEAPAGEHFIRVQVTDTEGRSRSSVFTFKIAP